MVRNLETVVNPIDPCLPFQLDLSCMVDDELDESSVSRVLVHMETCHECRDFLKAVRGEVIVHQHLADPDRLSRVLSMLEQSKFFPSADQRAHLRRLAAIYYRLGKAYLMMVLDKKYHYRLLEEPVAIQDYKLHGRNFVEQVIQTRSEERGIRGYDWVKARYILNGRLDNDEENIEKGRLLLEESLVVRPRFAEPRLSLAQYFRYRKEIDKSRDLLEWVFAHATKHRTRVSAALHLGVHHGEQEEFRKALTYSRWALQRGIDEKLQFIAYYNTAVYYMQLSDFRRAGSYLRALFRRQPGREGEVARYLHTANRIPEMIHSSQALRVELESVSPRLVSVKG